MLLGSSCRKRSCGVKWQKNVRVVIADDSAPVRKRLAAFLRTVGGVEIVGQAQDAAEAITSVRQLKPDVIILDIRMPGGGGIGVLEDLRKEEPPPVVIMLTNYPFAQYRRKCLEAGASFFFDKSTEFYEIPQAFEQLYARTEDAQGPERFDGPEERQPPSPSRLPAPAQSPA